MEIRDAIKILQSIKVKDNEYSPYEIGEAIVTAVEELEKRVPKRPIMKQFEIGICPSCGAEDGGCSENFHRPFCCNCGQALLWDEEENI